MELVPFWLPVGVCLSGDCDPVLGTICIWDYTVWETRAKLRSENRTVLEKWISQWNSKFLYSYLCSANGEKKEGRELLG